MSLAAVILTALGGLLGRGGLGRLVWVAWLALLAMLALTVRPEGIPIAWLAPLREGTSATNLAAALDPLPDLPWLWRLRGLGLWGDLRRGVLEHGLLVALAILPLVRSVRGGLAALAFLLLQPLLGHLLFAEGPGARVMLASAFAAMGLTALHRRAFVARASGLGLITLATAWSAHDRIELLALAVPLLVWGGLRTLAPEAAARLEGRWRRGSLLRLAALPLAAGLIAGAIALATADVAPYLAPLSGLRGLGWSLAPIAWLADLAGWTGPVAALCVVLGLLRATRTLPGAGLALGWWVLALLFRVASHEGEALWEPLRYHLVLAGPTLALGALGLARLPGPLRAAAVVAHAASLMFLSPTAWPPVHTSQQAEARFVVEAVATWPDCTFLARVVDVEGPPPPEDGHRPELLTWGWARFGGPVRGVVLGPDRATLDARSRARGWVGGCELLYVGLDCALEGARGCDALPPWEARKVLTEPAVPFNHHAGTWSSPISLSVSVPAP